MSNISKPAENLRIFSGFCCCLRLFESMSQTHAVGNQFITGCRDYLQPILMSTHCRCRSYDGDSHRRKAFIIVMNSKIRRKTTCGGFETEKKPRQRSRLTLYKNIIYFRSHNVLLQSQRSVQSSCTILQAAYARLLYEYIHSRRPELLSVHPDRGRCCRRFHRRG